jgi:hypothetical protein
MDRRVALGSSPEAVRSLQRDLVLAGMFEGLVFGRSRRRVGSKGRHRDGLAGGLEVLNWEGAPKAVRIFGCQPLLEGGVGRSVEREGQGPIVAAQAVVVERMRFAVS